MEVLKRVVEQCLKSAQGTFGTSHHYTHQAFGAVQLFIAEHPDQDVEASAYWNEVRSRFPHE